ncbi:unnamed protein product [Lactuca saligna]|uniref:Uncharacterized protein n=1 Tax=Lactuca saligna TaxID=75948 RepID=A0AA36A4I2_LACSI|nr:unnamed protein product [Lactuca saligna]
MMSKHEGFCDFRRKKNGETLPTVELLTGAVSSSAQEVKWPEVGGKILLLVVALNIKGREERTAISVRVQEKKLKTRLFVLREGPALRFLSQSLFPCKSHCISRSSLRKLKGL